MEKSDVLSNLVAWIVVNSTAATEAIYSSVPVLLRYRPVSRALCSKYFAVGWRMWRPQQCDKIKNQSIFNLIASNRMF